MNPKSQSMETQTTIQMALFLSISKTNPLMKLLINSPKILES